MSLGTDIEVKQNLRIIARDRGKIVARREGHNIWLNLGREYLAQLISLISVGPSTYERSDRIRYLGFGVGGNRQLSLATANSSPIVGAYPGVNTQTDSDPSVTRLERPVRISGGTTTYPGVGTDVWLGSVAIPPTHPVSTQTKFTRVFTSAEISYSSFLAVPLSEIGMFTEVANPLVYNNTMVAYDTFDTIMKTSSFELEVDWTIRF